MPGITGGTRIQSDVQTTENNFASKLESQIDSVEVGYETIISSGQRNKQATNEEEGLTNRVLKPKYSHRKNMHHLNKMADRNVSAEAFNGNRGAATTQLGSLDSTARVDNHELTFQANKKIPSKNPSTLRVSGKYSPKKKNSIDSGSHQLNGILSELTSKPSVAGQQPSVFNRGVDQSISVKSIDGLKGNAQLSLNNGVKLHELSRQQLSKLQALPELAKPSRASADTRNLNISSDEKQLTDQIQLQVKKQQQRKSVSQLKGVNNSIQSDSAFLQYQNRHNQSQNMTLPDVIGVNSHSTSQLKDFSNRQEMLIDDYNLKVTQPGYNKIAFKEKGSGSRSRKSIPTKPDMILKRQLKSNENSAIRIVKRQQNKFNMLEDSIMISDTGSPLGGTATKNSSIFKSNSRHQDSAMMNGLMASSASALKINSKASYHTATERLMSRQQSVLGQNMESQQTKDLAIHEEQKKLRATYEQMAHAEMRITNAVNEKSLCGKDCDDLLKTNIGSLLKVIVMSNSQQKGQLYTPELQQFVQSCCSGVEKSAKLRQKLLNEQIELFEKSRRDFEAKEAAMMSKLAKMKDELIDRPYQLNFNKEEDREKEIEDLFLKEEKVRQSNVIYNSHYSGAQNELKQLQEVFNLIRKMKVGQLQVSPIDQGLFENKEETIEVIDELIMNEGEGAVRTIAKHVLNEYYRNFKTAEASTQTEGKVIDALKSQLFELQTKIKDLKDQNEKLDREKHIVGVNLEQEKKKHEATRTAVKHRDDRIEAQVEELEKSAEIVTELKEQRNTLSERFKKFTDEINNQKNDIFELKEGLKSAQIKAAVRQERIEELEEMLKKTEAGAEAIKVAELEEEAQDAKISEEEEVPVVVEKKPKRKASAKPAKKLKNNASSKKILPSPKAAAAQPKTQTKVVQKLDPEAEKRLRESIKAELTLDLTDKVQRQATQKAKQDAQSQLDQANLKHNATLKVKQKKIIALETQVQTSDAMISDLQKKVTMLETQLTTTQVEGPPGLKNTSLLASIDGANTSLMESSQFPLQPKLNTGTAEPIVTDIDAKMEIQEEPSKSKESHRDEDHKLRAGSGVKTVSQTISPRNNSDIYNPKEVYPVRNNSLSQLAQTNEEKDIAKSVLSLGKKQVSVPRVDTNKVDIYRQDTTSIPRSLQSKQNFEGSECNSPKKFDSADLVNVNSGTPIMQENMSTSRRNKKKEALQTEHHRISSVGSQVEKSLLRDSTVYDENSKNNNDDEQSNAMSNNMQERYISNVTVEKIQLGGAQQNTGESYFKQLNSGQVDNPYGATNIGAYLKQAPGTAEQNPSIENASDSTLYKPLSKGKPNLNEVIVENIPNFQQLKKNPIESPENLFIESKQYQLKQQLNATFGNEPKTHRNEYSQHTSTTNRILDSGLRQEGERMLEGLNPPVNKKLEHYQTILEKAYAAPQLNSINVLEQAKEQLDGTELKLLMLMLQMRGQFDRKGGAMVSKGAQTEGVLIVPNKSQQSVRQNHSPFRTKNSAFAETQQMLGVPNKRQVDLSPMVQQIKGPSHVQVSKRSSKPIIQYSEVAVQAGDDLIKAAMDRVILMEKQKAMFFGGGAGDNNFKVDGTFSPQAKYNKNSLVLKEELAGDSISSERVLGPSMKQQKESHRYALEQARVRQEARQTNELFLEQLEYEHSYKDLAQQMMDLGVVFNNSDSTLQQPNKINEVDDEQHSTIEIIDSLRDKKQLTYGEVTVESKAASLRGSDNILAESSQERHSSTTLLHNTKDSAPYADASGELTKVGSQTLIEVQKEILPIKSERDALAVGQQSSREISVDENQPLPAMNANQTDYGNLRHSGEGLKKGMK